MEKTKLIIFPGNFVPHIGGLETHVYNFAKNYVKYADVTIFTPRVKNSLEFEDLEGIKVIRYPAFEIIDQYFIPNIFNIKFWELYFSLFKQKYDWVMTRTLFFTNSTLGLFFSLINKTNLIHVEHGGDFPQIKNWFVRLIARMYLFSFGNIHARFSDVLVGVSHGAKEFLKNNFWTNKNIRVIYRGFDKEVLKVKAKKLHTPSIVYVGRLSSGKGVQDLLRETKNEKYNIYIIGEGVLLNKLKKIKTNSYVQFLGKVSHQEVISYLKGADLFVNPSYTEGLPTTALDAAFSGCKVVATDVGGTREILDWNKKGFKLIKSKKELSEAISKVLKEKKEDVSNDLNKFNWNEHVKKYYELMK
jgi:glycosyltransferase involved in cell wall biosynthesis